MQISFIPEAHAASALLDQSSSYGASDIIGTAVALVVLVAGLASVIFIIWGGLMLILSGGKDDKVKPAINSIRYAVIGIIVIIIAIFVAPKVISFLGFWDYPFLSPDSIFHTIQDLISKLFGGVSSSSTLAPASSGSDFTNSGL